MSVTARTSITIVLVLAACGKKDDAPAPAPAPKPKSTPPQPEQPPPPARPDVVPQTTSSLKLDGEWDEPDWSKNALRHVFMMASGEQARPHSEVRLLHDTRNLYVGLYAADQNIQSKDRFEVEIGELKFAAYATGKLDPAIEGANAGIDRDGTLDDPANDDEEWVLEIAIPLGKTGMSAGKKTPVKFARCDVTKDNVERCGSWSGAVSLE